ncbi:MAG: hypothetical protein LBH85_03520 [Treponema sp.]|jgi:hypothetical protein|nr:hypothetical protein [Treponema sp.]
MTARGRGTTFPRQREMNALLNGKMGGMYIYLRAIGYEDDSMDGYLERLWNRFEEHENPMFP